MVKESKPIELANGVYWLGVLLEKRLEVNVYLRVFKKGDKTINMVIDPGPPSVFETVQQNLLSLTKDLRKINFTYINHQDPDVSTNVMYLHKYNPALKVICTEDTWRLISFLGLDDANFQAIDKFKSLRGKLSTGHSIRFVPTPFCHFRGAAMLYDESSRILFTGDLFGGITHSPGLFATSVNWHGMRSFHQLYMPSQDALRSAIDSIRSLEPKPEILAPQHGALIKGDLIEEFMGKLYDLPVGWSLLETLVKHKDFYIEAINDILQTISHRIGEDLVTMAINKIESDGTFPNLFEMKGNTVIDIKLDPSKSFKIFLDALQEGQPKENIEIIRNAVLKAAVDWNLPLFESMIDENAKASDLLLIEED